MSSRSDASGHRRHKRALVRILPLCAALALSSCGGAPPASADRTPQPPAVLRVGEVTIRASAVPSTALAEAAARQYGIARDADAVLLLVGVRRGPESAEVSLPARIRGSATDLLGKRQTLTLREVRSGDGNAGFIDYVGSVRVSPPDTLRFELMVEREGAAPATLTFSRDFFP